MIRLAAIGFCNKEGKKLLYNVPDKMKIKFDYKFGTIREEVLFAGGMIIAAPREDIKPFLTHESKTAEKLTLEVLYFKVAGENLLREFEIPRKIAISFQKTGSDEEAAEFAGTAFMKMIAKELPF